MNDMLQECADTIELLNEEKDTFQKKIEYGSTEFNIKLDTLKTENLELTLANVKLRNESTKLKSEKDLLQTQCNGGSDHNECLLRQMESERKTTLLEETLDRLQKTQISLESERCKLVTELDLQIDKCDNLRLEKDILVTECTVLLEKNKIKEAENEDLNKQVTITTEEMKYLSKENISVEHRIDELKISHEDKHIECTRLEKQLQNDSHENKSCEKEQIEKLQKICDVLNDEICSKNQIIKKDQLKLKDLKKVMQKEFHIKTNEDGKKIEHNIQKSNDRPDFPHTDIKINNNHCSTTAIINDNTIMNMQYLKHVILKFLISSESESLQLVKALSTLLEFSNEEEAMLSSSLEWRQSWFGGTRPKLTNSKFTHRHS